MQQLLAKSGPTCGGVQIFDLVNDTHLQCYEAFAEAKHEPSANEEYKILIRLKPPFFETTALSFVPATSYSPGQSPAKYHQR